MAEGAGWLVLPVAAAKSEGGVLLERQPDGSFFADGIALPNDTYTLAAQLPLKEITALRLEALPDPRLANNGPGRASDGNFILSGFKVVQGRKSNGRRAKLNSIQPGPPSSRTNTGSPARSTTRTTPAGRLRLRWAGPSRRRSIQKADRGRPDFHSPGTKTQAAGIYAGPVPHLGDGQPAARHRVAPPERIGAILRTKGRSPESSAS